jgi:hypothetical protein
MDLARVCVHTIDRHAPELDAGVQLATPRPNDLVWLSQSEGHEEQPGLIEVIIVLVNDDDLDLAHPIEATQAICAQRPTGPPTQDDDSTCHASSIDRLAPID